MSNAREYESRTEELLQPIVGPRDIRIYDVEFVKEAGEYYLRAYIDKDGGVNIQDCEDVSRALSDVLDREDFIPEAYILEVSSPGLGRVLKKDRHLQQSIGMEVEVKLYKPLHEGEGKELSGVLESFDAETVKITLQESGDSLELERKNIAVMRLALDF